MAGRRPRLRTRNLFPDTSTFVAGNFDVGSDRFKALAALGQSGRAHAYLSEITIREVEKKVREAVAQAHGAASRFRKDARVLRNIHTPEFEAQFAKWEQEPVVKQVVAQFDNWRQQAKATTLQTPATCLPNILDQYFAQSPPFGGGEKAKEFPDAFTVAALCEYCAIAPGSQMYVISADRDLECRRRSVSKYRRNSLAVPVENRMNLTRLPWLPLLNAWVSEAGLSRPSRPTSALRPPRHGIPIQRECA